MDTLPADGFDRSSIGDATSGAANDNRSIENLLAAVLPRIRPATSEAWVPLAAARGRALARDIWSTDPVPGFARAAMDGYALRADDCSAADSAGSLDLAIGDVLAAGDDVAGVVECGGAIRIFTGAPLPPGYDRVVMQEHCRAVSDRVRVLRIPASGDNVRPVGDDIAPGECALSAGTQLDARHLAVAASMGLPRLPVRRRLRVAALTTGNELVDPGEPLRPGAIYNSNRFLMAGLLEEAGFEVVRFGNVPDRLDATMARLREVADCDAIVTSGGVSVGDEDHIRPAVEGIGGHIEHWRLAIRPGKPIAIGTLPSRGGHLVRFIGLPGNPNAVFVTMTVIGMPILRALAGLPQRPLAALKVRLGAPIRHRSGRREYVPVTLRGRGPDGLHVARRVGTGGSAQQCALARAEALLVIPENSNDLMAGAILDAMLLRGLL